MKRETKALLFAASAYLFAVMPRCRRRAEKIRGNYYAHRGLHNKKTGTMENTMEAFSKAVEAGYGIELDVQLTRDEVPVVFHDFDLKRACGAEGKLRDYTFEELQSFPLFGTKSRIPRFCDVLKLVDGKVPLLVEIKCEDFRTGVCEKTDELLKDYDGEYVIESFHPLVLLWYRIHRPKICRGQLSMNFQRQEGTLNLAHYLVRHLLLNFVGRPDFIAYDRRDAGSVSRKICRRCFGAPCAAWTVKSKRQLEKSKKQFDAFIFEGFFPD
jgi:glycerophosphoryl diester phosphodiesterase